MCTDGAPVNVKMHKLIKNELGEHYLLTLCPAHKIELAIKDAFELSNLNNDCNADYVNIFYLFKKANLRWRLFKRQSIFEGIPYIRYKRPSGTRWVEHQCAALNSHINNLPIFIGFCNNQILNPHNPQIKKIVAKLEGYKSDVCDTKRVVFEAIKLDVLRLLEPVSKTLQEASLLTPKLLSVCRKGIKSFEKLLLLLNRDGKDAFHRDDIFKTASEILEQLSDNEDDIIPERRTRAGAAENPNNRFCEFHGYLLKGDLERAMEINCEEFKSILESLIEALKTRLQPLLDNDVFRAISIILDSESYKFLDVDIIYDEVKVIVEHFKPLLLANNCRTGQLKDELEVLYDHINRYVSKSSAEKCWPIIFRIGNDLGIRNLLHILELCLVTPLSNAESERVFSLLWRIFSKERQSLKNDTLELLLHIRSDDDQSKERYKDAVDMFLNEYPDGTIRKKKRHLQGHVYPSNRTSQKKHRHDAASVLLDISSDEEEEEHPQINAPEDVPLEGISDDEWSSDDE